MYYKLWPALVACIAALCMQSCKSGGNMESSKSKKEYVEKTAALSGDNLKKALELDRVYVDSLIDIADGFHSQVSFGFGVSGASGKDADAAKPFKLEQNMDSLRQAFNEDLEDLRLNQAYAEPTSEMEISEPLGRASNIRTIVTPLRFFVKGNVKAPNQIGLSRVDSAEVQFVSRIPVGFDTATIKSDGPEMVAYGADSITVVKIKGGEAELEMPVQLYAKVLKVQAVNEDGKLMDSKSFNAFPVTTIKKSIYNGLLRSRELLKAAAAANDAAKAKSLLEEMPEIVFETKDKVSKLLKDVEALEKQKDASWETTIKAIRKLEKDYETVLGDETQNMDMAFPEDISALYLYMGNRYDSISGVAMAKAADEFEKYYVYKDSASNRYGILDSNQQVLVKASLENYIRHEEGNYFSGADGDYYFDPAKKSLTSLGTLNFIKSLDNDMAVFEDTLGFTGVLKGNSKEVLPFKYDDITALGNNLVVAKSLRGRKRYQLINTNGDVLAEGMRGVEASIHNNTAIVTDKEGKEGLMDENGKMLLPYSSRELKFIYGSPYIKYSEGMGEGLMASDGRVLTEPKYYDINFESNQIIASSMEGHFILDNTGKATPVQIKKEETNPQQAPATGEGRPQTPVNEPASAAPVRTVR